MDEKLSESFRPARSGVNSTFESGLRNVIAPRVAWCVPNDFASPVDGEQRLKLSQFASEWDSGEHLDKERRGRSVHDRVSRRND
jgi:hypothetical protein